MKIATVFLLVMAVLVHGDEESCPSYCTCKLEGANGVNVFCSRLSPKDQRFGNAVQHLVITNDGNKPFSLTDNIFVKLGLQKLESIKIVNNSLTDISVKAFQGLTSLFDVNLSDNQLFLIHGDTFVNNTNLHRLKLSGNHMQLTQLLQSPREYLLRSSSLTDFDLSNCQLSQILPKTFSQMKNLVFLTLSSNYLKTIPIDVFEGLEYLEELDLSHNNISRVERSAFKMNKELSVLKLRANPIEALNGIDLPSLEELDLSQCKLRILMKECIDGMTNLELLNLSSNNIEVISDDSFTNLLSLKHLDMSNNKLIGPLARDLFKNNHELESLSLSGNKDLGMFVEQTGFVEHHLAMTLLEVADCGLTRLTSGHFRGIENLNVLNVSDNAIRELDDDTFKNLKRLNTLDLSNNMLVSLSVQLFASNSELVRLRLSGNPIKYLPLFTFSHTPNLRILEARGCGLERLWDAHKRDVDVHNILPKLAVFDVSGNRLRYVHEDDFSNMRHLESVDLSGNPLECAKTTIQLIEWFVKNEVQPYHQNENVSTAWNELISNICRVNNINHAHQSPVTVTADHSANEVVLRKMSDRREMLPLPSVVENTRNSYVDEIVLETDSSIMWPMVLAISLLIVALYFVIYLVGEITHRRRALAATYARAGALGGHVRTRGSSGSPLYYKLYEECSIPTHEPAKTKKNYVLDFSPIHTILKKNSYRIMRSNNEANV